MKKYLNLVILALMLTVLGLYVYSNQDKLFGENKPANSKTEVEQKAEEQDVFYCKVCKKKHSLPHCVPGINPDGKMPPAPGTKKCCKEGCKKPHCVFPPAPAQQQSNLEENSTTKN